jgi:hypothetical protein
MSALATAVFQALVMLEQRSRTDSGVFPVDLTQAVVALQRHAACRSVLVLGKTAQRRARSTLFHLKCCSFALATPGGETKRRCRRPHVVDEKAVDPPAIPVAA